jgi:hypothetical protein
MYKLTLTDSIKRLSDNASIPADPSNRDYAKYLEWLSEGNTPTPTDPPSKDELNGPILATLAAADLKIIRSVVEGDTVRIAAYKEAQALLRAQLK